MVIALDLRGFAVSSGAACSSGAVEPSHVLMALGLTADRARASIRFSLGRGDDDRAGGCAGGGGCGVRGAPAQAFSGGRMTALPIAVAMSGGVDSSTVAAMLARSGQPWSG